MNIKKNIASIQKQIEKACVNSSRDLSSVHLMAVSKTISEKNIRILLNLGHRIFGENRVQEAVEKWQFLKEDYNDIDLHLIGPLQSNKTKQAIDIFDVIETLDRPRLALELLKYKNKGFNLPKIFVQVNVGEENNKSGCPPKEAEEFIKYCLDLGLNISGVMGITPLGYDPSPFFAMLVKIARSSSLTNISMGMTNDFETAIYMGSTHVRIGSGIFGERDG